MLKLCPAKELLLKLKIALGMTGSALTGAVPVQVVPAGLGVGISGAPA